MEAGAFFDAVQNNTSARLADIQDRLRSVLAQDMPLKAGTAAIYLAEALAIVRLRMSGSSHADAFALAMADAPTLSVPTGSGERDSLRGLDGRGLGGIAIPVGDRSSGLGILSGGLGRVSPSTTPATSVRLRTRAMGGLPADAIEAVVDGANARIDACKSVVGTASVTLSLAPDGTVASAHVRRSNLGNETTQSCVLGEFERLSFPSCSGDGPCVVVVDVRFSAEP